MKKVILTMCIAFVAMAMSAQETFSRRDNILNLGVGVGEYGVPMELKWEMNVLDGLCSDRAGIGVGAVMGWNYKNRVMLAAQGNFHFQFVNNLDTWAGLSIGGDFKYKDAFYIGPQIGTRYYFADHWAVMAEFGYGISFAKIGVTYKF